MINTFKDIGYLLHLIALILLIRQILNKKNCLGLSYKTQEIYLVVFIARYTALIQVEEINFHRIALKLIFLFLTIAIIFLMRFKKPYCITYDQAYDSYPHRLKIYPLSIIITIIFHLIFHEHQLFQYFWTFSVILEAFALLPQIHMLHRIIEIEVISFSYLFCLGLYQFFFIMNWIINYREFLEWQEKQILYLEIAFGTLQTLLFLDFSLKFKKFIKRNHRIAIRIQPQLIIMIIKNWSRLRKIPLHKYSLQIPKSRLIMGKALIYIPLVFISSFFPYHFFKIYDVPQMLKKKEKIVKQKIIEEFNQKFYEALSQILKRIEDQKKETLLKELISEQTLKLFQQEIDEVMIVEDENIFKYLDNKIIISENLVESFFVHKSLLTGILKLEFLTKNGYFQQSSFLNLLEISLNANKNEQMVLEIYSIPLSVTDQRFYFDFLQDDEKRLIKEHLKDLPRTNKFSLRAKYDKI